MNVFCYLLRNGEPQRAEILRDDSAWGAKCLGQKNIRIRQTVSRKIKIELERVVCTIV